MSERIINHPLRTITFKYDDEKPETEYEKQLLIDYIAIHDRAEEVKKMMNKLLFEYLEWSDSCAEASKTFKPIADQINSFYKEAQMEGTNGTMATHKDLEHKLTGFFPQISEFHESIINSLDKELDKLNDDFDAFDKIEEKFSDDFDAFHTVASANIYREHEKHSLDLCSYDDDEQDFRDIFSKISEFSMARSKCIDTFNEFMGQVKNAYKDWDDLKHTISKYYDDKGLLDCSLSESYANGTGEETKKPLYFLEPGNPKIKEFKETMGLMGNSSIHTINISVDMEVVKAGKTYMVEEYVLLLQHFPKMIEKWIFAMRILIKNEYGNEMDEMDWKGHDIPVKWYSGMRNVPCVIFFLEDRDARAYVLMGDIVIDQKLGSEENNVLLEGDNLKEVCDRIFNCCRFFLLYCHNTGFDPKPYVEGLLADFDVPVTYEHVKQQYDEDVKNGIKFRVVLKKSDD